ncbi:MAG: methyltransferase domain-containing protein [Acidilobus sp.]
MVFEGPLNNVNEFAHTDVSGSMLSKALSIISALCSDGCTTIPANAESLPFRDAQFDVAYSFHVANLLERPAATSY